MYRTKVCADCFASSSHEITQILSTAQFKCALRVQQPFSVASYCLPFPKHVRCICKDVQCNHLPGTQDVKLQICYAGMQTLLLVYNDAVTALVSGTDGHLDGCVLIAGTGLVLFCVPYCTSCSNLPFRHRLSYNCLVCAHDDAVLIRSGT